jgi:FlaA1/EpsC-like NDP-sugar epimerase
LKLVLLYAFGQFSGLLSYFSVPDFQRILYATGSSSLMLFLLRSFWSGYPVSSRGVILIDFILSTFGIAGVRLLLRLFRERRSALQASNGQRARRVGIIGAGDVGANLARELIARRGLGLQPVAFFDDAPQKWHSQVHGIPVIGAPELLREANLNLRLEEAIIAMPSASARRIGEVVRLLQSVRLKFETVPSVDQLATGKVKVSRLRAVEIQDLLGREPVKLETDNIRRLLRDRVVVVTGAGGSIGAELCRQIATFDPQRLLLVEQSEVQIFPIEQELIELGYGGIALPLVADILDQPRLRYVFGRFRPAVVFHAAAHKHVSMMEGQPSEAIKNNAFGTARMAELALEFGVDRFVMISTDKAINPTSVMGATKRLAEMFLQSLAANQAGLTRFMAVRFGNVLGSSGSVIPIFNKQIAAGGPVKVTHPDVVRYFMTIPEAVGLVLQSAAQGDGSEIFVLDMGQPVKIVDLARQLIELSGLKPDEDIQIEFTGLRPGEKLFEELSYQGENYAATNHPKIMRFYSHPLPLAEVRAILAELEAELHQAEPERLKLLLKKAIPEYQPFLT